VVEGTSRLINGTANTAKVAFYSKEDFAVPGALYFSGYSIFGRIA
jgi:hypothetical protein